MGWYYRKCSRRQLITELTGTYEGIRYSDGSYRRTGCERHVYIGSAWKGTLWAVFYSELVSPFGTTRREPMNRWICAFPMQYDRSDGSWGYKPLEESVGPYVYNCPLSYLTATQFGDGRNASWREGVLEYHKRKKRKPRRRAAKSG